jgi:hypothetical protein
MKRQAYEVIEEIEKKFKDRSGCMLWSWSMEHIAFLIQRWLWKKPGDKPRISEIAKEISERAKLRMQKNLSPAWLYLFRDQVKEMIEGAGMKAEFREYKPENTGQSVVMLAAEARAMGIDCNIAE